LTELPPGEVVNSFLDVFIVLLEDFGLVQQFNQALDFFLGEVNDFMFPVESQGFNKKINYIVCAGPNWHIGFVDFYFCEPILLFFTLLGIFALG